MFDSSAAAVMVGMSPDRATPAGCGFRKFGHAAGVDVNLSAPLSPDQAKRLAVHILENGTIMLSPHADERGAERSVTTQDIENTLRGGVCLPAEWNQRWQEWRYTFETSKFGVASRSTRSSRAS